MDSKTKFLIYCMEIYRRAEKLTQAQVLELFSRYNVSEYVLEFYETLYNQSIPNILQDINDHISKQSDMIS